MKKLYSLTVIVCLVFLGITAFDNKIESPVSVIKLRHEQRLQVFIRELEVLAQYINDNSASDENIQTRFIEVRRAFKAWEYLGEHLDPMMTKDKVNGAPLPKIERNSFGMNIMEPRGIQVLDELIFSDNIDEKKDEIQQQLYMLISALKEVATIAYPVYDRTVLEAARMELVRLFTLGLTGFDVPGSGNSVTDAITVLQTMREDLLLYQPLFMETDAATASMLYINLNDCISYLEGHNDFDSLDRLYVLRTYINPLFAGLLNLHQQTGIEMIHEVTQEYLLPPYNHLSDNLFANDFLDPHKYIRLPKEINSPQMVELGKMLFFDPVLSSNNKRACASCHDPKKAFTDGLPKSTALSFEGTVDRNAPTLINCVYNERFFHDMRSEALEDQIEHVLTNRKEFDTDMLKIIEKLKQSEEYVSMFNQCFSKMDGDKLNGHTISFAVSAYVSSLRGFNSPFDKYVRGEQAHIDDDVRRGFNLFMGKAACGTCHFAPVFNGTVPPKYEESESEVLGVAENPYVKNQVVDPDLGRGVARLKEQSDFNKYAFKTPTVRNAALTAPYMHNGAYKTLEDVMDFYNKGGGEGFGIHLDNQTLPFDSLSLNKQEIKDIVAFMKSLTDTAGMTSVPPRLPLFNDVVLNNRKVGGEY